ncbi:MAG: hypothetical protein WCL32_11315 [Planctomycetota bacterium]|jgi:hypothetical protein
MTTQTRPLNDAKPSEAAKATRPPSNILPLNFDLLGIDTIKKELQKLSATNQEILKAFQERAELPPAKPKEFGSSGNIVLPIDAEDLAKYKKEADQLKKENELLRKKLIELDAKLRADVPTAWKEQQREFDQILDEKTETIRSLHMQVQELQEALRGGPTGMTTEQLDQRQDELARLEQRLLADEEALNRQAREMEMSMAKERADLARQRAEMQRFHTDVQREIEVAGRDPGLRERLMSLQRRPDTRPEGRPKTANSLLDININPAAPKAPQRRPATMAAINLDTDDNFDDDKQKPGLLRRLFGG